jgi:hypothetical protein
MERQQNYGLKRHHGNGMIPLIHGDRIMSDLHKTWALQDAEFELLRDENKKLAWMERFFDENPEARDQYLQWGIREILGEEE